MPRSKVTAKYQVTIPKQVRDKVGVRPGEVVSVDALSREEIRLRRFPNVAEPLKILIGEKTARRAIPVAELEKNVESR